MSITIPARVNTESIRLRYLVVILRRADVLDIPQPGQADSKQRTRNETLGVGPTTL